MLASEILLDELAIGTTEIVDGVFIMPDIIIHNSLDTHFKGMYKKVGSEFISDEFDDELFLVLRQNEQINIVTACSHRGITNICTTATEHFNLPVGLILGGFHMKNSSIEQYGYVIQCFNQIHPKSIGVCHCTGMDKYSEMIRDCESHLFYNFTGNEIKIE